MGRKTQVTRPVPHEVSPSAGRESVGDKGKKDKGKREVQKKSVLDPKEKRKLKREKKNK